jgi:hypothetical protein
MIGRADHHAIFSDLPVSRAALLASALYIDSIARGRNVRINLILFRRQLLFPIVRESR